jgi:IS605 OrfB family transposase
MNKKKKHKLKLLKEKKIKDQELKRQKHLEDLKKTILNNKDKIKFPTNLNFESKNIISNCNINISKENNLLESHNPSNISYDEIKDDGYKTSKVKLNLNENQKLIIDNWFNAYIYMYNQTVRYLREKRFLKQPIPSLTKSKADLLNIKKDIEEHTITIIKENKIIKGKNIIVDKKIKIDTHILDLAINDCLNHLSSCLTNIKDGNIKYFRLRYLKFTKPNKILKIEKQSFLDTTFCSSTLGEVKCYNKSFNYRENIYTTATITKKCNDYFLLLKYKRKHEDFIKEDTVYFDPGIRIFLTGISNNHVIEIGSNLYKDISKQLKNIDNINKSGMNKNKKSKVVKKKYNKIKNQVNDIHWKLSRYLVTKYRDIFIGNFSTKSMGESDINDMVKRVGNLLSFYSFKKKLQYMAKHTNTNYKQINEAYTSKCCGSCGNIKENLGGNKTYICNNCGHKEPRDIGGARKIGLLTY